MHGIGKPQSQVGDNCFFRIREGRGVLLTQVAHKVQGTTKSWQGGGIRL